MAHGPLHGFERVIGGIVQSGEAADIEGAFAAIFECRKRGVLAKNLRGMVIVERLRKAHAVGELRQHPPIRPGFAKRRAKRALARNAPFGIRHGSIFFGPGHGRQAHMGEFGCVVVPGVGDDHKRASAQGFAHAVRSRQADRRVSGGDP